MKNESAIAMIKNRYEALGCRLDEKMRRQFAGAEAASYGWGGVSAVAQATGLAANTIKRGQQELATVDVSSKRIRRVGGGRKRQTEKDSGLSAALDKLVDPTTRGDPQSPLRWTCKSTAQLSRALCQSQHIASPSTVRRLLKANGYSLQGNRKTMEGQSHPDRNAQFEHINDEVKRFQQQGYPVISVDTKKKELVGEFKNGGREWNPKGQPDEVKTHDFMDKDLGKAIPYGIYDITQNEGWVSVGIDHDTARFAAEAIARWWEKIGKERYSCAPALLITSDSGGCNASRSHLWKMALQELAERLQMDIYMCHLPPGTSKWNKIEHRMFCHITQNWRGKPLISHEVIVNLIAATTTTKGLKIYAELDNATYPTGLKVSKQELSAINITLNDFHGDWNYSISPAKKKEKSIMLL